MIQNAIFFLVEFPDIHECGGMTIYLISATKLGRDFEEGTGSIFYVIRTLPATRTILCVAGRCIASFIHSSNLVRYLLFRVLIRTALVLYLFALACGPRFLRDADLT